MIRENFHQLRRFLAKLWLEINSQLTVVGVTGSYGKTSAVRAIAEVLKAKYSVNRTDLNLDTIYNLPITILKTKMWNEVLILEYGVDHLGEMDEHLSLVKPKIALLTGITPVHADKEHFGSLENIIREKRKLIDTLPSDGLAIFNYDDEEVRKIGKEYQGRKISFGTKKEADVWASEIKINTTGTTFKLSDLVGEEKILRGVYTERERSAQNDQIVETGLLGYPAVYSCLAAWVVGKELKMEKDKILMELKELHPLEGRFSIGKGPLGTTLVNDSLRANLFSTVAGLKSFAEFPGRKVAILGEMGEVGEKEEEVHWEVGKEVARLKLDLVVGVGPLTKYIIEEAEASGMKKSSLFWSKDVQQAASILRKIIKKGDLLYLKASLLRHLERVIFLLEGKAVNCKEISCHHYSSCTTCPDLHKRVK